MKIIDLSHEIHSSIPVYPGTKPPSFVQTNTIEQDGFAELTFCMATHTATHMDAPAHILPGGKTLDRFDAAHFAGRAVLIDALDVPGGAITANHLEPYDSRLERAGFALIHTGWSRYWGEKGYFEGFPALTAGAAEKLAGFRLQGVGIDAISVDPIDSYDLPVHHILLGSGILIIENLARLDAIRKEEIHFICLPLKIIGADGSPARAVAII